MIPAIPSGPRSSAISSVSRSSCAGDVVDRLEPLAGLRAPDDQPVPAACVARDAVGVVGVDRLAQLEHHVVADVDDVADRALAGGPEPHLDPIRRRTDRHAVHPAADEPRAPGGIAHVERDEVRDVAAVLDRIGLGPAERRAGDRRDLAGEPDERQRVAAVRLHVDVQDDVAVEVDERHPDRRVRPAGSGSRRRRRSGSARRPSRASRC